MLCLLQVAAVVLAVMAPANIALTVNFLFGLPMWAMLPALVMMGAVALFAAVSWVVEANVLPSIRVQGSATGSFLRNRAVRHCSYSAGHQVFRAASSEMLVPLHCIRQLICYGCYLTRAAVSCPACRPWSQIQTSSVSLQCHAFLSHMRASCQAHVGKKCQHRRPLIAAACMFMHLGDLMNWHR